MNYKILIVDDESANLRLLERLFRREYQVLAAGSGAEALELLKMHDVAVIISDQRMPAMTGIEFLKRAAEMRPHTVRIILTGYTDVNALVEVINSGVVYKYATKPWVNEDLQQTVVRAVEHYETIKNRYELTVRNERLEEGLNRMKQVCLRLLGDAINLKDPFLHAHLQRVAGYAVAVGERLNLSRTELEQLLLAAFLHGVGQLGASADGALLTDAAATAEERHNAGQILERGAHLLANIPEMNEIVRAVRCHREHFDGSGAPGNLAGEQIPLFSRIIAVAKAYDEMIEPRDETTVLTHAQAAEKLRAGSGGQFDEAVVAAFSGIAAIEQIRRTIADGIVGMQLAEQVIACDEKSLSTGEVLQKFKTEPLLALDVLKMGNLAGDGAPSAQMLPLMSKIGEANLRSLLGQCGLPAHCEAAEIRTARAMRRAVAAQLLAAHTDVIHADDAYTLGLLSDIGETLLQNLFPGEMRRLETLDAAPRALRQTAIFGIDAAQISRWMLEANGVPPHLTAAIENYPDFMRVNQPVALVMRLAREIAETTAANGALNSVENSVLEALNLSRADLNKICERTEFISQPRPPAPPMESIAQVSL